MKTFKDLIDQGVAPTFVSSWGSNTPNSPGGKVCDNIIINYNRSFGLCNDTHMDRNDRGFCITGSAVADTRHFNIFLHSTSYANVSFPCTPMQFFKDNCLCGDYAVQNGALIYQLCHCEEGQC